MKVGTLAIKSFRFSLWNATEVNLATGYYELVGDLKMVKFLEKYGIPGLTKCVKVGDVVYMYVGFDELPEFNHYKITDYAVFYFTEYPAEGKILGTDKIRNVKVFELLGFFGNTWLDFVEWLKRELEDDFEFKLRSEEKQVRRKVRRRRRRAK